MSTELFGGKNPGVGVEVVVKVRLVSGDRVPPGAVALPVNKSLPNAYLNAGKKKSVLSSGLLE